jgi:hypothetical protein
MLEGASRGTCGPARCCPAHEQCNALAQLRGLLEGLSPELRGGRIDPERVGLVAPLAERAGLTPAAPPDMAEPPTPAKLLGRATLEPIDQGPAELLTDPPGGTELTLMFHQPEQRTRLCTLSLITSREASCIALPAELARGAAGELLGAEPDAPARLLLPAAIVNGGAESHELVAVATGSRLGVILGRAAGGYAWRDGTAVVLTLGAARDAAELHRFGPRGAAPLVRVPLAAELSAGPVLLFDELVWIERAPDGGQVLRARRLQAEGELLGPSQEVGRLGPVSPQPSFEGCRTAEALVVLVRGEPTGYHTDAAVALRTAEGWHPPMAVGVESDSLGLTCYGRTASLSFVDALSEQPLAAPAGDGAPVEGVYALDRTQCTIDGCTHQRSEIALERLSRSSRYVLADLGGSVAVLWRSPLGDVRLRLGPLETIDQQADQPLFDDEPHGGFAWELGRGAVFAREGHALLLARTTPEQGDFSYALTLDATGALLPVAPAR